MNKLVVANKLLPKRPRKKPSIASAGLPKPNRDNMSERNRNEVCKGTEIQGCEGKRDVRGVGLPKEIEKSEAKKGDGVLRRLRAPPSPSLFAGSPKGGRGKRVSGDQPKNLKIYSTRGEGKLKRGEKK